MTDTAAEDERVAAFVERVESETGYEVDAAPELGDELGWFSLDLTFICEGEEFVGATDFELSESGVKPLYAEITVDLEETHRRQLLATIGERLISAEGVEDYQYEPDEAELQPLLEELREIHADVFD
jgi:hypothetical protein